MLRPKINWEQVYPPQTVFTWYIPEEAGRWLTPGAWMSGFCLPLSADQPALAHESMTHPRVLQILRPLYSSFCSQLEIVSNENESHARLKSFVAKGFKIHTEYRFPEGWLPSSAYTTDPDLYSKLNNKASLEDWVPSGSYPNRFTVELATLRTSNPLPFPYVLKAVSDFGSGGGIDVVICREDADKIKALAHFSGEEKLLAEEWVPDARVFCVQGAILREGSYQSVGSSEQICDELGGALGNWVGEDSEIGPEGNALAEAIIRKAGEAGYRGFAGIDILKTEDGRLRVIDLNFRHCNSTRGLLVFDDLKQHWNWNCMTVRSLTCSGDPDGLLDIIEEAVAAKKLCPWAIQISDNNLKMVFLAGGRSREEVENQLNLLQQNLSA